MLRLLRFRSLEECEQAEHALAEVPGLTTLPSGVLALPEEQYEAAATKLEAAGIDWRWEPVEGYIGGRAMEEERP
jgi:hypothetical protein